MNNVYAIALVAVVSIVTILLRAIPFLVFGNGQKTPKFIVFLSKYLPYAIMGMLVVYCLKGVTILSAPYGIPELLAVAAVVLLHVWKRNTLLSIGGGTVLYMIMVQFVFA